MTPEDQNRYNAKAHIHVEKAQKKLKGGVFKNLFSTKNERIDEGLEHYKKAIDNYKLAKNWTECALINLERAKLAQIQKEPRDEAEFSAEAGSFFLKASEIEQGVKAYKAAVDLFRENGNFENVG